MSEPRKLFVNKPKKAQLKQFQQIKGMDTPSSSSSSTSTTAAAASSSIGSGHGGIGGASMPPEVPKESFARRYKFIWPLLLTVNLAVGAYIFMRTKKKEVAIEDETTSVSPSTPNPTPIATPTSTTITESPTPSLPVITKPLTVAQPIPEHQQRELFKWMLEEKRKIKTNDPEVKKRIEEDKAILKQFIRAKSIPTI